jgi:ribose transport system permease protein
MNASSRSLRDYAIIGSFLALFVVLSLSSDVFLTSRNLLNILDQSAAVGIIACGATLVIIAGGFDLSVAAIFAISGVVATKLAGPLGSEVAIVAGVLTGLGLGVLNGLLVTLGGVHSFIATLASGIVFRGIALIITGGLLVSVTEPSFTTIGRGELAGVKYSVWIFAAFFALTAFLLTRTTLGRFIYAVGGNAEAARLSGIRVELVRTATFAISGLGAGIAGVVVASRVASGQADAGAGLELTAIAAVVLGGTSILGGEGAVWRSVVGVLILAMIGNGFNLLDLDPLYQQIVEGSLILLAVAADAQSRRARRLSATRTTSKLRSAQ